MFTSLKDLIKPHTSNLKYLWLHKRYVYIAGRRRGLGVWQLLTHDLSKLRWDEWQPYAQHFYGVNPPPMPRNMGAGYFHEPGRDPDYDMAWLLHQKRNPHHWQFWILQEDSGAALCLPMPERYRVEMLADWDGAGLAQVAMGFMAEADTAAWYLKQKERIKLHPWTRILVERDLGLLTDQDVAALSESKELEFYVND
jgi:hypothetical protein